MSRLPRMLILCCLLPAPLGAAEVVTLRQGIATLEVHFERTLTLADTITATLTIDATPTLEIKSPREFPASSAWLLVERSREERAVIQPGLIRWKQVYRCAPREPGEVPFRFPDVQVRSDEADVQTIAFDPIGITVKQPTVAPELSNLRDITAIEEGDPVPPPADRSWLAWSAAVLALILLSAGFLARRWLGRKKIISAADRALYEWQRLIAKKLPEQGRAERFITLLTLLLRHYLERDLDWPARRQTEPEFLRTCVQSPRLSADEKSFLTEFVQRCEAVKFARVEMTAAECEAWALKVRRFLELRRVPAIGKAGQAPASLPIEKFS